MTTPTARLSEEMLKKAQDIVWEWFGRWDIRNKVSMTPNRPTARDDLVTMLANALTEQYFRDSFLTATKKQIWSAGYHKMAIESAERGIEWHRLRLGMIKEKTK